MGSESLVDSGKSIVKQAVQHEFDPGTPYLADIFFILGYFKGELV